MSCPIDIDDVFVWTEDYKAASKGDTVVVDDIWVDEDAVAQLVVVNYRNEYESITATDIQEKVHGGLLEKQ